MKMQRTKITDLPMTQRPRERMSQFGSANLSNEELLAILLGSGTRNNNVLAISKLVLKKIPLNKLVNISSQKLAQIEGIGSIQAGKILAAIEMGRRLFAKNPAINCLSPKDAINEAREITNKSQEHLVGLYLNARYELIDKKTISIGGLFQLSIEPREIFQHALIIPSPFIILIHNHPSGEISPSIEDINFTKKLIQAGSLLGIKLIDHIIISEKGYFSFKEEKQLKF